MASQVQIRPEPADHYLCHPNIMPDSAFCKRLKFLDFESCRSDGCFCVFVPFVAIELQTANGFGVT